MHKHQKTGLKTVATYAHKSQTPENWLYVHATIYVSKLLWYENC